MLRPARPLKLARHHRVFRRGAAQRLGPGGMDRRLGATQEARANLHRACAQKQGRRYAPRVRDAAGRHHGHLHGVRDGGQQREQADLLAFSLRRVESAPVAAGLRALGNEHVRAGGAGGAGLGNGGDGGEPGNAARFIRATKSAG